MGFVFFLTLTPIILAILAVIVIMAIIGIIIFVVGVGGSVVSATAVSNRRIKTSSLYFFISLVLLGLSCLAVLGEIFMEVSFFAVPTLIIIGLAVIALGVIGIVNSLAVEQKAAKITLLVLLSLSSLIGAIVTAIGTFMFIASVA